MNVLKLNCILNYNGLAFRIRCSTGEFLRCASLFIGSICVERDPRVSLKDLAFGLCKEVGYLQSDSFKDVLDWEGGYRTWYVGVSRNTVKLIEACVHPLIFHILRSMKQITSFLDFFLNGLLCICTVAYLRVRNCILKSNCWHKKGVQSV
jgi:hypothetical protein